MFLNNIEDNIVVWHEKKTFFNFQMQYFQSGVRVLQPSPRENECVNKGYLTLNHDNHGETNNNIAY